MMNDNVGETKERRRRLKTWAVVGGLLISGAVAGFVTALLEGDGPSVFTRKLPMEMSIILAVSCSLIMAFGSWFYWRNIDEVERNSNVIASATSAGVLVLIYPPWFLLWKGGVVTEPSHTAMFLLLCATGSVIFLMKQYSR
jgi:hypothetical protein